jgi:hypothetical protein
MTKKEFAEFKKNLAKFGQSDPIVVQGSQILDGRHRYLACKELGIEPKIVEFRALGVAGDPVDWILAQNLARRHLNRVQRAAMIVKFREWKRISGSNDPNIRRGRGRPSLGGRKREQISAATGLSERQSRYLLQVDDQSPKALDAIITGALPLTKAVKGLPLKNPAKILPTPITQREAEIAAKKAMKKLKTIANRFGEFSVSFWRQLREEMEHANPPRSPKLSKGTLNDSGIFVRPGIPYIPGVAINTSLYAAVVLLEPYSDPFARALSQKVEGMIDDVLKIMVSADPNFTHSSCEC